MQGFNQNMQGFSQNMQYGGYPGMNYGSGNYGGGKYGYGKGDYGKGDMYGKGQYMPEVIKTATGKPYRGVEKVKMLLDPPFGEALARGDADVLILPNAYMKRVKEVLPYLPLQVTPEEWQSYGADISKDGKQGVTENQMWELSGYKVQTQSVGVHDEIKQGFQQITSMFAEMMKQSKKTKKKEKKEETSSSSSEDEGSKRKLDMRGAMTPTPRKRKKPRPQSSPPGPVARASAKAGAKGVKKR